MKRSEPSDKIEICRRAGYGRALPARSTEPAQHPSKRRATVNSPQTTRRRSPRKIKGAD